MSARYHPCHIRPPAERRCPKTCMLPPRHGCRIVTVSENLKTNTAPPPATGNSLPRNVFPNPSQGDFCLQAILYHTDPAISLSPQQSLDTVKALILRRIWQPQCSGIMHYISTVVKCQYMQPNDSPRNQCCSGAPARWISTSLCFLPLHPNMRSPTGSPQSLTP
jgi:hypothetical protein